MSKFKVGDRIRLRDYGPETDYKSHRGEVAVVDEKKTYAYDFHVTWSDGSGSCVHNNNAILVTEGGAPVARRTFKQLKESVTVKKNALWQEACDDGTQEYVLLNADDNKDGRNTQRIYDRSLVEDNAAHFVEVFAVTPQFMTREELDQWEAFKKASTPARKKRAARESISEARVGRAKASAKKVKAA